MPSNFILKRLLDYKALPSILHVTVDNPEDLSRYQWEEWEGESIEYHNGSWNGTEMFSSGRGEHTIAVPYRFPYDKTILLWMIFTHKIGSTSEPIPSTFQFSTQDSPVWLKVRFTYPILQLSSIGWVIGNLYTVNDLILELREIANDES